MIRLSVTDLDTYRYWKDREDGTLEELLAELTGVAEETRQMKTSKAFHKALEVAEDGDYSVLYQDGYRFDFAVEDEIDRPQIRELKGERLWQTSSGPVTLVGKVDGLTGLTIMDYKLSERFEAERYTDSLQWRAYLAIFHCDRFVYEIFQCKYDERDHMRVWIHDLHHFALDRYPDMEADLDEAINELAAVVLRHCPQKVMR